MKPGETQRNITLKGTPEAIEELKRRIDEIVTAASQQGSRATNRAPRMEQAYIIKVAIPNERVGIVIGRQGFYLFSPN